LTFQVSYSVTVGDIVYQVYLGIICNAEQPIVDFVKDITVAAMLKPGILLVAVRICRKHPLPQSSLIVAIFSLQNLSLVSHHLKWLESKILQVAVQLACSCFLDDILLLTYQVVVLTGPQIFDDCARLWLGILRGTHPRLYYPHCVYMPLDPAERGTVEQARTDEYEFFRAAPWSSVHCTHRLGVDSLLWALEKLWEDLTQDMLAQGMSPQDTDV
jgi:hypothetical protein